MKRQELKYILSDEQKKYFIKKFKFKLQYSPRFINSIYYDSNNFIDYRDSVEGITPRIKNRIRFYNNSKNIPSDIFQNKFNNLFFEKKITYSNYRFKDKKNISKFPEYIYCNKSNTIKKPKLLVSYFRKYYTNQNLRATNDTQIFFSQIINGKILGLRKLDDKNVDNVFELKFDLGLNTEELIYFQPQLTRFSKYSIGISNILSDIDY